MEEAGARFRASIRLWPFSQISIKRAPTECLSTIKISGRRIINKEYDIMDQPELEHETIAAALQRLGVVNQKRTSVFAHHTRDRSDVKVYRDDLSGVIFIERFYVGDMEYQAGAYRKQQDAGPAPELTVTDLEDHLDTERRYEKYKQFFVGKNVCDFGCGAGTFLRKIRNLTSNAVGIELQTDYVDSLRADGIGCYSHLNNVPSEIDAVFMFHSFEHLPHPAAVLRQIQAKLEKTGGRVIIEVPHARDFLIEGLGLNEFIKFTLWSQHLILHTRQSLTAFLTDAGFKSIKIEGVQRYDLSNHLHWLRSGGPGGHKADLSIMDTPALRNSYADSLARLDMNDTLVAVASV